MPGRWYHRNINGIQAEKLLQEYGKDGSFLIRPSQSTINSYTLSVRCANEFKHIKIQNNGDCYEIGEGGDKFATLAELVEHFIMKETLRDKSDGTVLVLRYPLACKEPTSERYFHGSIDGNDANNLLLTKGKSGSYLVRESRRIPENYVLCVRCDNKIVNLIINCTPQGYTMQNFNQYYQTLDELITECIRMCPIVDDKDNVVNLKQPLNSSRVNGLSFDARVAELNRYFSSRTKNGFSEEFESLQQVESKFLYERKVGNYNENRAKNRFKTILPFDRNRVILKGRTNDPNDPSTSDYINANKIGSEDRVGKQYIATQGPLPTTIIDFWTMIWQEGCQVILMITHEEEKGKVKCSRYWPEKTSPSENNYVNLDSGFALNNNNTISSNDTSNHPATTKTTTTPASPSDSAVYGNIRVKFLSLTRVCDDYVLRKFLVTNLAESESDSRHVYQFQYLAWSDHSVPENVHNTLSFVDHVNKLYNDLNCNKPITVHCSAGIGRTGAIIVIDMIIDKINTFGIQCDIDIYKAVYHLRSQRSGMIQTEKQYQFLYTAIKTYIDKQRAKKVSKSTTSSVSSTTSALQNQFKLKSDQMDRGDLIATSTPRTGSLQTVCPSASDIDDLDEIIKSSKFIDTTNSKSLPGNKDRTL